MGTRGHCAGGKKGALLPPALLLLLTLVPYLTVLHQTSEAVLHHQHRVFRMSLSLLVDQGLSR